MKKEYSSQFKEIRKKRVFLFSTYGLLEFIRTTQKRFIEVFGDAVAEHVCPVMKCDVTVEEFAYNIAKWVIEGIK